MVGELCLKLMPHLCSLLLLAPLLGLAGSATESSFTLHRLHLYGQRAHRDFAIMEAVQQARLLTSLTPLQELSLYVPDETAGQEEGEPSDSSEGQGEKEDDYDDDDNQFYQDLRWY